MSTESPSDRSDRRPERTRRALHEAFLALLQERAYETLRIQDITDRAQTSKVTFYRYYRDMDDLYLTCVGLMIAEFAATVRPPSIEAPEDFFVQPPILRTYEFLAAHETLWRILLNGQFGARIQAQIVAVTAQIIAENVQRSARQRLLPIPLEIFANHIAIGLWGQIVWWFNNGMPYSPRYMAEVSQWLLMTGTEAALGAVPDVPPPTLE